MNRDLCVRDVSHLPIGEPCPDCQHTGMCHPGSHNPTLNACVLCLLLWDPQLVPEPNFDRVTEAHASTDPPTVVNVRNCPVGAVKLHPMQGTIWVKLGELSGWQCVGNQAPRPITATADVTDSWPVVGAVPFSPAAAWWDRVRKGRS